MRITSKSKKSVFVRASLDSFAAFKKNGIKKTSTFCIKPFFLPVAAGCSWLQQPVSRAQLSPAFEVAEAILLPLGLGSMSRQNSAHPRTLLASAEGGRRTQVERQEAGWGWT